MAILAAILFPVFAQARDAARRTTCLSNLRQLAGAHQIYVQDYDDTLPSWYRRDGRGQVLWPEFLSPYYRDPHLLDEGVNGARVPHGAVWVADYVLCAWGAGGQGTPESPFFRWPGAPDADGRGMGQMKLGEVLRPAETMQFADGITVRTSRYASECSIQRRHGEEMLIGAFLDGHAQRVPDAAWQQLGRDEDGYYYRIAAADR
jgi:hypothetical protein